MSRSRERGEARNKDSLLSAPTHRQLSEGGKELRFLRGGEKVGRDYQSAHMNISRRGKNGPYPYCRKGDVSGPGEKNRDEETEISGYIACTGEWGVRF